MAKETQASNIIFSYVPLLVGIPGVSYMGKEAVEAAKGWAESLDQLPSGAARACIWMAGEEGVCAVFAMEQCDDIAAHFEYWSEGKPEEWFACHFLEKGPSYCVALIPNFKKSSERWKLAFQLRHGYPPVPGGESLIFRPLHCVAKTKQAFDQAKKFMKSTVRIGLVGADEVSPENFRLDESQVRWLGQFRIVSESKKKGLAHGWLNDKIEEMWKEESGEKEEG